MSTNVNHEFVKAQERYLQAKSDNEKLEALEEMMRYMPQHKGAENLRANIRQRYKKLKGRMEAQIKQKKLIRKEGIKKQGIQAVLIGLTQSGKSSLISLLTNVKPLVSSYEYTTKQPIVGALKYQDISFQIIDMPAINYETFDSGLLNTADILLIIITNIKELEEISPFTEKANGKKIIVFNKTDLLTEEEKRKISAFLQSKKYNFVLISCKNQEGIEELKNKLVENSQIIRIYTKQPGKELDKHPVLLPLNSSVQQLAEKIFHKKIKIKQIRVTGPSSKFPNQLVGLQHQLKDKDVVEFYVE